MYKNELKKSKPPYSRHKKGSALCALLASVLISAPLLSVPAFAEDVHYYSVNSSATNPGSNYNNNGASGRDAVAVGAYATASGDYSLAAGRDASAAGSGSTALGDASSALGYHSLAVGYNNYAEGGSSIAAGVSAKAVGTASIAAGFKAAASGDYSIALGDQAEAVGYSIAMGYQSAALGLDSTAAGNQSVASGDKSLALGNNAWAMGDNSLAAGTFSDASGTGSVALGNSASAEASRSVAIGAYSTADREGFSVETIAPMSGADLNGVTYGALSVGDSMAGAAIDHLRQIIYVGDGTQDTDAVNLRQLRGGLSFGVRSGGSDIGSLDMGKANSAPVFEAGDGLKAEISDGNKIIFSIDTDSELYANLKGDKGDKGDDGRGVAKAEVNEEGNLIVSYMSNMGFSLHRRAHLGG